MAALSNMFKRREPTMEDSMPQELTVPLAPRRVVEHERQRDPEQEAAMAAAAALERYRREREDLQHRLMETEAMLSAKGHELDEAKLLLAQERDHVTIVEGRCEEIVSKYRAECDQIKQDFAHLHAFFGNVQASLSHMVAMFERFQFEEPGKRKRRNGKRTTTDDLAADPVGAVEAVSDEGRSETSVS